MSEAQDNPPGEGWKLPTIRGDDQEKVWRALNKIWLANSPTDEETLVFTPLMGTILFSIDAQFAYLPPQERQVLLYLLRLALIYGFCLGKAPDEALQVFEETQPRLILFKVPEWADAYFREIMKETKEWIDKNHQD